MGWNSLLSGMVSRYLFVTDYDEEGTQILSWCLMSKEPRNKGYIDPFVEVQDCLVVLFLCLNDFKCLDPFRMTN